MILKGLHLNSDLLLVPQALPNRFAGSLPLLLWLCQNQLHQWPDINERWRTPTTTFSASTYLHPPTDVKYDSIPTDQLQMCSTFCTDPLHSHFEGAHTSLKHPHPISGKYQYTFFNLDRPPPTPPPPYPICWQSLVHTPWAVQLILLLLWRFICKFIPMKNLLKTIFTVFKQPW